MKLLNRTKVALLALLERNPNLCLAVAPDALKMVPRPGWHVFEELPVTLG